MRTRFRCVLLFLLSAALLFACGCRTYRAFLTDRQVLERAQQFVRDLAIEDCEYRIWTSGAQVTGWPEWRAAALAECPDALIYANENGSYFFDAACGMSERDAFSGIPADRLASAEQTDFSFAPYDAQAKLLLDFIKCGVAEPGLLRIRYNRDCISISDYLYYDFEDALLADEAFQRVMGKRYDRGFLVFLFQGKRRSVSLCQIHLFETQEDGSYRSYDRFLFRYPYRGEPFFTSTGGTAIGYE